MDGSEIAKRVCSLPIKLSLIDVGVGECFQTIEFRNEETLTTLRRKACEKKEDKACSGCDGENKSSCLSSFLFGNCEGFERRTKAHR